MSSPLKTTDGSQLARPGGPGDWPSWITPELVAQTRLVWEPHYRRPLSEADALEILLNAGALARVLLRNDPGRAVDAASRGSDWPPQSRP